MGRRQRQDDAETQKGKHLHIKICPMRHERTIGDFQPISVTNVSDKAGTVVVYGIGTAPHRR